MAASLDKGKMARIKDRSPSAVLGDGDRPLAVESVAEKTIAFFRAKKMPGTTEEANRVYAPFNERRDATLYPQFMPNGTKLDLADSDFVEDFAYTMPWGPPVRMCGMVRKGTKRPHGLVRFVYVDKGIIEATAVDGKFVGLYTRVNGDGKMIFTLVWGPGDQLQYLARINYKTKDWKPYMSKGPHLEFLQSRVGAVIGAFAAKN